MIHLIRTHHSLKKGIIQVNDYAKEDGGPLNLVNLAEKYDLNPCFVVDSSMEGLPIAYRTLKDKGINLVFGLLVEFVSDPSDKDNNSAHKNIIFVKNEDGYKRLIKISTKANVDFFNSFPRMSYEYLLSEWSSDDLVLGIPFYDSFLARNTMTMNQCIPTFVNIFKPVVLLEDNDLPFDQPLRRKAEEFARANSLETVEAQTVYYEKPEDFLAYQAFRCTDRVGGRQRTYRNPNLDHFGSKSFCFK